jgi:hypothetical protein
VTGFAIGAERPRDATMGPEALLLSLLALAGLVALFFAARTKLRWFSTEIDQALAEGARLRQLSFVLSVLSMTALAIPMARALHDDGARGLYDLAHYWLPTPYPLGLALLAMASASLFLWEVALVLEAHALMRPRAPRVLAAIGIALLFWAGVDGLSHGVRGAGFFGSGYEDAAGDPSP